MIPKTIHYCWFGRNPKPKLTEKCIKTWKKLCPDYEIIEWNEDNFPLDAMPLYVRQAYEAKKWAFVTDYVRLQIVFDHGGIYLDTDVEIIRPLDGLLNNRAYFGFEDDKYVNTGHGFGAEKGCAILKEIMSDYADIPFNLENGEFDKTPCPRRNTEAFLRCGLVQNNTRQCIGDGVLILPSEYFAPKNWKTGELNITENTYSVHHYDASWYTPEQKKALQKRHREEQIRHLPSTVGTRLLGKENYEKLRGRLKG